MNIQDALSSVQEPAQPRDGDCLHVVTTVTAALLQHHFDAARVTVVAWTGQRGTASEAIVFAHNATLVDGVTIVDFTARQFHGAEDLPARWIVPVEEYCAELAKATCVDRVTTDWPQVR